MKKDDADTMRDEYDFGALAGGVRGKYAQRLRAGSNLVLLDPDVAQAFPGGKEVNDALRAVLQIAAVVTRAKPRARRKSNRAVPRSS